MMPLPLPAVRQPQGFRLKGEFNFTAEEYALFGAVLSRLLNNAVMNAGNGYFTAVNLCTLRILLDDLNNYYAEHNVPGGALHSSERAQHRKVLCTLRLRLQRYLKEH